MLKWGGFISDSLVYFLTLVCGIYTETATQLLCTYIYNLYIYVTFKITLKGIFI